MPVSATLVLLGASSIVGLIGALVLCLIFLPSTREATRKRRERARQRRITKARKEMRRRERKANDAYIQRVKEYYDGIG